MRRGGTSDVTSTTETSSFITSGGFLSWVIGWREVSM